MKFTASLGSRKQRGGGAGGGCIGGRAQAVRSLSPSANSLMTFRSWGVTVSGWGAESEWVGGWGVGGQTLGSPRTPRLITDPQMRSEFIPKLEHSVTHRVRKVLSGFSGGWGCLHSQCMEYSCECRQTRASLIDKGSILFSAHCESSSV